MPTMRVVYMCMLAGLMLALALACSGPVSPSVAAQGTVQASHAAYVPQCNAIAATFAYHADGPLVYVCATLPRTYGAPGGVGTAVEDHYLQYEPCPATLLP